MDRIIESIIQIFQQKYNLEKFDTTTVKQAGKKKVKKKKTEKKMKNPIQSAFLKNTKVGAAHADICLNSNAKSYIVAKWLA